MSKGFVRIGILAVVFITLTSWGSTGHRTISLQVRQFFNEEMDFYDSWIPYLSEHSSDADWRKDTDPDEFPRHFIDLDNYPEFNKTGQISQDLERCTQKHGASFMKENGFLPWATLITYDSLVYYLKTGDYSNGKRMAADLSHYVADGHMPLHLTRNYDGQFSENTGIHFRYEIEMIDRYDSQITYTGKPAVKIDNITDYVFAYLYSNYPFAKNVLKADDRAKSINPDLESDEYYRELWKETSDLTRSMYSKASYAVANLMYTAWIEAGRPEAK